jgi:hypothetical protein
LAKNDSSEIDKMKKIFLINILHLLTFFSFSEEALKIQSGASIPNQNYATDQRLPSSQGDGIIGSWDLVLQAFDDNSNGKLDDNERKKGNSGRHFYQFNTDGTCLIHTLKKDEGGKKRLYTYVDDQGTSTRENAWYVISVSKAEMILLSQDKYAFWIYKRV